MRTIIVMAIAWIASAGFSYCQSMLRYKGIFTFPLEKLESPPEIWPYSVGGFGLITRGVFYHQSQCLDNFAPDTIFITPYLEDSFSFEAKVTPLTRELQWEPNVYDPGPVEEAMYFVQARRVWRKSPMGIEYFTFQDCELDFEAEVLGETTYFMPNPNAGRRSKAVKKINAVLVLVTHIYQLEPLKAQP